MKIVQRPTSKDIVGLIFLYISNKHLSEIIGCKRVYKGLYLLKPDFCFLQLIKYEPDNCLKLNQAYDSVAEFFV